MIQFKKFVHYNVEIEHAVIGICMLERDAFSRMFGLIDDQVFYSDTNRVIFSTMREMYESGLPIDIETVVDYISRVKRIDQLGADNVHYAVSRTTLYVVSGAHLEYHCHVLKSMWMEREIIKLTQGGIDMDGDVRRKISVLQNRLQELNQKSSKSDWQDMTELMVNLYRHQAEMQKTGGMGITTGFKGLDKESGGFHPGQLVVIGARPSVGKSALAGQMAVSMASSGLTVGIISLEMNNNEIAARLAAIDAEIDFNVLYRGLYSDERQRDWVYERIGRHTSTLKIFVSDKTDVNINEIRVKAQKLKHLHGLDCLFIDYLQLIDSDETKNSNRENEIRKISRGAKIMAKEMNIPVIELCQLNREVTKRKGHERYPQLSDLRESGSIEQDADVVMFLHRDFMSGIEVDENGNSTQNQADIVVRKWRNGNANFIYPLDFDPPKMKFRERGQFSSWKRVETTGIDDENPF
jgi:replicative DNA helicase